MACTLASGRNQTVEDISVFGFESWSYGELHRCVSNVTGVLSCLTRAKDGWILEED